MEEIKVSEMLQADSINKDDSVMIIQEGVNKKASGSIQTATGTSLSLTSVADTCKVKSNSKNLVNPDTLLIGYQIDGAGTIAVNSNRAVTDYIEVKPETNYVVSGCTPKVTVFYDSTNTLISTITNATTYTTPADTKYIRYGIDITADYSQMQLEEGDTATAYNPYNTKAFVGSKNYKVSTNVVNGYLSGSNAILTGSANSRTTYIEAEPNTKYYIAKPLGNKLVIALSNATPSAGISVYNNIVYDGQKNVEIDSGTAKYLLITYWNINETMSEEELMASLIISKDLQKLNLLAGEEKTAFTYNEETSISSNGSVTATYSTKGRLLNNDDTTAIKKYVDRGMSNEYNINLSYTTIASTYQFFKSNGIATITAGNIWIGASLSANSWLDIGTIPSACIPKIPITFSTAISDGYNGRVISYGKGSVTTDGKIRVMVGSALTSQNTLGLNFSVTYLTN